MTFRTLKFLTPALAVAFIASAAATANAAPVQRAALNGDHAPFTLVDHRDGRGRGGHDRQWRGPDRGGRHYGRDHYRPYYRAYRAPRYVYAPPPAYYYPPAYYPYDDYYFGYPRTGSFSFSSPNLGFSFGY
ncbi:MAG: hypothetical protein AB7I36_01100 [Rhodospirillaceae bacterium]